MYMFYLLNYVFDDILNCHCKLLFKMSRYFLLRIILFLLEMSHDYLNLNSKYYCFLFFYMHLLCIGGFLGFQATRPELCWFNSKRLFGEDVVYCDKIDCDLEKIFDSCFKSYNDIKFPEFNLNLLSNDSCSLLDLDTVITFDKKDNQIIQR